MQPTMDNFDKATLDRFMESMTPTGSKAENKIFFPDIGDNGINNINQTTSTPQFIPPIPTNKVSITSSNDADYDSNDIPTPKVHTNHTKTSRLSNTIHINKDHLQISHSEDTQDTQDSEAHDDPQELDAMRAQLFGLVSREAQSRGMHVQIPQSNAKYGSDADENELITLYNQQSLQNVIKSITTPLPGTTANTDTNNNTQQQQQGVSNTSRRNSATAESLISPSSLHQSPPSQHQQQQQSPQSVVVHSQPLQPQFEAQGTIHPAVQKLFDLQQELLAKLELLEKDDPDPQSAKLWSIMQRIFTEENAQQRQRNIADLTSTLEEKHKEVQELNEKGGDNGLSVSDQRLLRSIHEMSKETKNELKEMRQQLNEERKKNNELRSKIRKKNRQIKVLSSEINGDDEDDKNVYNYTIPPMSYDPNSFDYDPPRGHGARQQQLSLEDDTSISSFGLVENKKKPSSFHNWCMNMGFQPSNKKCSWF